MSTLLIQNDISPEFYQIFQLLQTVAMDSK